MQAEEIGFLFAYDCWATRRVLAVLDGLDLVVWSRTQDVGERGRGAILVHHLGASQRWRIGSKHRGCRERTRTGARAVADDRRASRTLGGRVGRGRRCGCRP